jgi:hypothetical protein
VLYLPFIAHNYVSAPDLTVSGLSLTSSGAVVVIRNLGNAPVTAPFWVDLYANPNPPPSGPNQIWSDGRSAQGMVWGVTVPIPVGGTLTLTSGDSFYSSAYSHWSGVAPNTPIFVQVDSVNLATTYGNVWEVDEASGGPYNNILGPVLTGAEMIGPPAPQWLGPLGPPPAEPPAMPMRPAAPGADVYRLPTSEPPAPESHWPVTIAAR